PRWPQPHKPGPGGRGKRGARAAGRAGGRGEGRGGELGQPHRGAKPLPTRAATGPRPLLQVHREVVMSDSLVQIRQLTKHYTRGKQTVEVLHGIDLDIARGDFVAL